MIYRPLLKPTWTKSAPPEDYVGKILKSFPTVAILWFHYHTFWLLLGIFSLSPFSFTSCEASPDAQSPGKLYERIKHVSAPCWKQASLTHASKPLTFCSPWSTARAADLHMFIIWHAGFWESFCKPQNPKQFQRKHLLISTLNGSCKLGH